MKELIMLIINLFSFMNLKNKTGTNIENKPIKNKVDIYKGY